MLDGMQNKYSWYLWKPVMQSHTAPPPVCATSRVPRMRDSILLFFFFLCPHWNQDSETRHTRDCRGGNSMGCKKWLQKLKKIAICSRSSGLCGQREGPRVMPCHRGPVLDRRRGNGPIWRGGGRVSRVSGVFLYSWQRLPVPGSPIPHVVSAHQDLDQDLDRTHLGSWTVCRLQGLILTFT